MALAVGVGGITCSAIPACEITILSGSEGIRTMQEILNSGNLYLGRLRYTKPLGIRGFTIIDMSSGWSPRVNFQLIEFAKNHKINFILTSSAMDAPTWSIYYSELQQIINYPNIYNLIP